MSEKIMETGTEEDSKLVVCGGCNAKMGPSDLHNLLDSLDSPKDKNLLVGYGSTDDAAVYKVAENRAVIQTLDFFPSMVTDPYLFGEIAATNALSDVFAMGGDVLLALNILCYPEKGDRETLKKILQGGQKKIYEAGGVLAGGHSIHDKQPKYGLSVTGEINPNAIIQNNRVKAGDMLILTKKLGVGLVVPSYESGVVSKSSFEIAVGSMTTLNRKASEIMRKFPVTGCTDVTGFGLAGHLSEMLTGPNGENLTAIINAESLPIIPEAYDCAEQSLITAGGRRNRKYLEGKIEFGFEDYAIEEIVFDPQTSGGLLIAIPEDEGQKLLTAFSEGGVDAVQVGTVGKQDADDTVKITVK